MKRFNVAVLILTSFAGVAPSLVAQTPKTRTAQADAALARTDLATLIQSGDSKHALERIQAGANVNQAQPDGTTPLLWAVNRSAHEVVDALVAKKANPNVANEFGALPLLEAARLNDAAMVKALLGDGAKVDSANPDGETALMLAIKGGDQSIVEMLINAGANVNNIEKFHNQTPLMYASAENKPVIVRTLLAKGASVKPLALYTDWPSQITSEPRAQYRSVGGLDALQYAARAGCYSCVDQLIAAGADVNRPTQEGITPLMNALDNSHNEVAKLLLDKGANPHVWDWWGRTALYIAVDRAGGAAGAGGGGGPGGGGRGGAGGGGRGGAGGGRGATPGGTAPAGGAAGLAGGAAGGGGRGAGAGGGGRGGRGGGGANVARGGGGGEAPPAQVSSMDMIKILLAADVDPNTEMNFHRPNAPNRGRFADNQWSTGTTPLFRAVQNNDLEAAQALLAKGANPNINTMGYTALLIAAGTGGGGRGGGGGGAANTLLLDTLIGHGADVNAKVTGPCCGPDKLYSFDVSRENLGPCREPAGKGGSTALHEAARSVRTDMVKYLLDHGANPNLLDVDGKKPIDVINVQRPRGGDAPPCAPTVGGQAPPQGQGAAPAAGGRGGAGGGRGGAGGPGGGGGGGGRGNNTAAAAEIRTLLEAAAAKK